MNGIVNYHDAQLAMAVGNNGLFNKPVMPGTFSSCSGSSVIPSAIPVISTSTCCGGGSLWGGGIYGGGIYTGGGCCTTSTMLMGNKTFNALDDSGATHIYADLNTKTVLNSIGNRALLGLGDSLVSMVSSPQTVLSMGSGLLGGAGSLLGNIGSIFG